MLTGVSVIMMTRCHQIFFLEETVRFFTSLEYQIVKDFIIKKARQKKIKK